MPNEDILRFESKVDGDIGLVQLGGRLMAESRYALERPLRDWADSGVVNIVIACTDLEHIDSAGLSTLIGGMHKARKLGGNIVLCSINAALDALFEVNSMTKYFEVFEDVETATEFLRASLAEKKKKGQPTGKKP